MQTKAQMRRHKTNVVWNPTGSSSNVDNLQTFKGKM